MSGTGIGAVSYGFLDALIPILALALASFALLRRAERRGVVRRGIAKLQLLVSGAMLVAVLATQAWAWKALNRPFDFAAHTEADLHVRHAQAVAGHMRPLRLMMAVDGAALIAHFAILLAAAFVLVRSRPPEPPPGTPR